MASVAFLNAKHPYPYISDVRKEYLVSLKHYMLFELPK
jgi:hypothetical protein